MQRGKDYQADLLNDLKDSAYASAYLSAALAESSETFLIALRDVAESREGVGQVAEHAGLDRVNLYRMLAKGGNPRLSSLLAVMKALGLKLSVASERAHRSIRNESRRAGRPSRSSRHKRS